MEIKYEAVFGSQELFDGAEPDVFLVETNGVYKTFHKETTGKVSIWTKSGCDLAMRRIIRTPTWTVADQKAGKLPAVGAIVVSDGFNEKCEFLGVGMVNGFFVVRLPNGLISINSASSFSPIESPEEKAARLRVEWCKKAIGCAPISSEMQHYEMKRLGKYVGNIHDALLSGELPMPKKEDE